MSQSLTFPVPSVLGSLEAYIQAAHRFPVLTAEEEFDLARRLHEQGDVEAARQLVLSHLRLVIAVARGYLGYGLPHADLIQEGNIGLMKAVKRFDPTRGVRLVSFALHWIKAEIHEYILRNWRLVKVATTKAQRKLFFNLRSMKNDTRALSPQEVQSVARQLGVKAEEVVEMETRLTGQDISLEPHGRDEEDFGGAHSPIHYLADTAPEPSESLASAELEGLRDSGLQHALSALDPRSRDIIARRWLVEGEAATLHELAAEYGVSAERIRQIEARAMKTLKASLGSAV